MLVASAITAASGTAVLPFSTPKVRYFLYRSRRGGPVVEEVLGDEFEGVLVSGFYGACNVC